MQHGVSRHVAAHHEGCRGKDLLVKTILILPLECRHILTTPSPSGQVHCGSKTWSKFDSLLGLPAFIWWRIVTMSSQGQTSISTYSSATCMRSGMDQSFEQQELLYLCFACFLGFPEGYSKNISFPFPSGLTGMFRWLPSLSPCQH